MSFIGSPLCPFTHWKSGRSAGLSDSYISISGRHRSSLATGSFFALRQPFAFQRTHQRSLKQFTTYVESDTITSRFTAACAIGRLVCSASSTAVNSMR